jgi:hypothetical protein
MGVLLDVKLFSVVPQPAFAENLFILLFSGFPEASAQAEFRKY